MAKPKKQRPGVAGVNLKRLRNRAGISQRKLAEISGVHAITIAKVESGETQSPDHRTAARLAGALGIGVSELVDEPMQSELVEPLIEEFLRSPWQAITKASEDELNWLRGLGRIFWSETRPTPESISLFIQGKRKSGP